LFLDHVPGRLPCSKPFAPELGEIHGTKAHRQSYQEIDPIHEGWPVAAPKRSRRLQFRYLASVMVSKGKVSTLVPGAKTAAENRKPAAADMKYRHERDNRQTWPPRWHRMTPDPVRILRGVTARCLAASNPRESLA
jgi:hypothetical protein